MNGKHDDGAQIFRFTYKWEDDSSYNLGYSAQDGYFIGTTEEFEDMRKEEQNGFGFDCWDIKKVPASEEDLREYEYWK